MIFKVPNEIRNFDIEWIYAENIMNESAKAIIWKNALSFDLIKKCLKRSLPYLRSLVRWVYELII